MNITIRQALGIYDELINAYHNENGYGGNTAEIYIYRMMECHPTYERTWNTKDSMFNDDNIELETEAFLSLYRIIKEFIRHHDSDIEIDGMSLEESYKVFVTDKSRRFAHRVHIKVIKK